MKQGVDYIGVTCVFYCHDGKGNFLLHKRSKNCRDEQGRWDCGGGSMEFCETFEETVKREIKEEYDCDTLEIKYGGVSNVLREHNGKPTHWIALLFAVRVDSKKVKINVPEKMDAIGWFSPDKFPKPLHSMLLRHFEQIKKANCVTITATSKRGNIFLME